MDKISEVENQIQPNSSALILSVQDYDVLLGRGKLYDKHLGNQTFQGMYTYDDDVSTIVAN